jgi:DNA-binding LytR/AlgR family response regulator
MASKQKIQKQHTNGGITNEILLQHLHVIVAGNAIGCAQNHFLQISNRQGFHNIQLKNLLHCCSNNSYTYLHLANHAEPLEIAKPLSWFEATLSPFGFSRVHSKYLVNMVHIDRCCLGEHGLKIMMNNGSEVSVSRQMKKNFMQALAQISIEQLINPSNNKTVSNTH